MTFDGVSFIIVEEIALFADQEGAYTYAGLNAEDATEEATTEEVTTEESTEAPTSDATEAPTDAPSEGTEAPTATTDGCGSVVGFGVMALLGAAFVALKKDRD